MIDLAVAGVVCGKLRFRWTILLGVTHLMVDYVIIFRSAFLKKFFDVLTR